MDRLSNYYRTLLLFLVTAFYSAGAFAQDCQITLQSDIKGCAPFSFKAKAKNNTTKTVQSYAWSFGDNSTANTDSVSHFYASPGCYTVSVTIKYTDGTECIGSLTECVRVWAKPKANIGLPTGGKTIQCFKNLGTLNNFCFTDQSTRGADGAAINKWLWNFGDGQTSDQKNPCHTYDAPGVYTISLEVWDANGCADRQVLTTSITVLPDISTTFTLDGEAGCDSTQYTFINKADTNGAHIVSWLWNFGDGNTSTEWSPKHTYKTEGKFPVTLTVTNKLGCTATSPEQQAENIIAKLELFYKDTICWEDASKGHSFSAREIPGAFFWQWSFDDPPSGVKNVAPFQWTASHEFMSGPKNYQVKFVVNHPVCGVFDTCIVLHVMGPQATIIQPDPIPMVLLATNDYKPATPMPKSIFTAMNASNNCVVKPVPYSVFNKINPPIRKVKYEYCNATITSSVLDTVEYCDGDVQPFTAAVNMTPTDSVVTLIDSAESKLTWVKGQPIPAKPYYQSSGQLMETNMHDTNLFTCTVPDLVRFTNHSLKYRLYNALDNNTTRYVHWTTPEPDYPKDAIFDNGYRETCKTEAYPFASDSMKYLWSFNDPLGKACTSTVTNKDWECNFSTLIAPYHYYGSSTVPVNRCQVVTLKVTDEVVGCEDQATLMLKQGPPQAWWDRSADGYCKMTWEMQQFMTAKGVPGEPDKPLRGFIMNWNQNCTGPGENFRLDFSETLPSCEPAKEWWVTFDSAQSTRVACNAGGIQYLDHGFLGSTNSSGYQVGGPKALWNGLPWMGNYWYMNGDEGCKTIGVVLKNAECYDTAWYHDYICFTRLTAEFDIYKENVAIKYDPVTSLPYDTVYTHTLMDSSLRFTSQNSGVIYCHSFGAASKPGFDIKLTAHDRAMEKVSDFLFQIRRQEFPAGDYYYTRPNPGSALRGFWPDTATLNPYKVHQRKTDSTPINPNNSIILDSISSIYDTVYIPVDSAVYTFLYDANGNPTGGRVYINGLQLRTHEVDEMNNTGKTILPTNDFRSRFLSLYCNTTEFPVMTDNGKLQFKDTIYLLDLYDNRIDKKTFIMDRKTGLPTVDSIPVKDTVRFTLPHPGFYTIQSASRNLDGCVANSFYHLIYGHFARFNIVGGDSIICVGDTITLDYTVRYWTTACPPPPGSPPPAGCINGTINNYSAVLTPWDVADAAGLRKQLDPQWKKPANYKEEEIVIFWGDGSSTPSSAIKGKAKPFHKYTKPGIYDITMRTTDSNSCTINTIRRNYIHVVGVDAKFVASPERDTVTYCRKDVVLRDQTELVGSKLNIRGKFGYKDRVVKRNPFSGEYYFDSTTFITDSISKWVWDPANGTTPFTRTNTDTITLPYLRYGTYSPGLKVFSANTTPKQCSDEQTRINYLKLMGPRPDFSIEDTVGCMPHTLTVHVHNDTSDEYEWILDGAPETYSSVKHQDLLKFTFNTPGRYRFFVRQKETHFDPTINGLRTCYDEWPLPDDTINQFWVTIHPYTPISISGDTVVCVGEAANLTSTSSLNEYKLFTYKFGNGAQTISGPDASTSVTFNDTGYYWVEVEGTTDKNCIDKDTIWIRVEGVKAVINVDSSKSSIGIFSFINRSTFPNSNADSTKATYRWNFGDGSPEVPVNNPNTISHEYSKIEGDVPEGDEGKPNRFKVTLTTISPLGCESVDSVWVEIPLKWKRYNVLTPNGDGKNDVFNPKIGGETEYSLEIFNRWGERVFVSDASSVDWNGKVNNTGADCPEGTYFYVWKFKLVGGYDRTLNGTVTLLR